MQHTQLNNGRREAITSIRSTVSPALFYDGRDAFLIFPFVLLVQLSCLAVGRTVGVWLIKQGLQGERRLIQKARIFKWKTTNLNQLIHLLNVIAQY